PYGPSLQAINRTSALSVLGDCFVSSTCPVSYATKSVVFNAVPLFALAALYLVVTAALAPALWRERRRLTVLDVAVAAMFPCIAIPAAIYGAVVLHDRQPIGGHVWPPFGATLLALVPGVLL